MMHDLSDYDEDALIERAWELHDHTVRLMHDPNYAVRYFEGRVYDPFEGYHPADPWYSVDAIENHLEERGFDY
jgi:hypothetical protein